jgi:hypothetical protein
MGLFLWGKNTIVERTARVCLPILLENNGFTNSTKDYSLNNPILLAIISLRCKVYSQMKITHLDKSGKPIENSDVLKPLRQPNYFQSQEDFLFQQMWFCLLLELTSTK